MSTKKTTRTTKRTSAPKSPKKKVTRIASFKVRKVKNVVYFTPVNKKAKKLAHSAGRRTLVTKSDLKTFKKQGSIKFGVYVPQGGKDVLKMLAV